MRERRRQRGLPLPVADKVLPFRAIPPTSRTAVEPLEVPVAGSSLDAAPLDSATGPEGREDTAWSAVDRVWLAEQRLREAPRALEQAEQWGAAPRELERVAAVFTQAERRLREVHRALSQAEQHAAPPRDDEPSNTLASMAQALEV